MKTEFLRETLVMKSLARRELRRGEEVAVISTSPFSPNPKFVQIAQEVF